ncbi:378_t:CDS:2 [Diversispora eburnea]|uniref:378_t:CDS:1 n=1 Tax=Diversispora eburnea TaxID=1213867 RepID=A0A9N8VCA4_9GLOM|nr:378_t:CDS:2 [Diversispora eburnea]
MDEKTFLSSISPTVFKTRVTESKWTKLFVLASILQLCCVVSLEARVLHRNNDFKKSVSTRYEFHKARLEQCNLKPSIDRMSLIAQENIVFMVFQLFQLWFCLNAIYNQNVMQIITIAVINFICGLFGIVQIFEILKWCSDLDKACAGESAYIDKNFGEFDVPLVICLILFATIIAFLSFKLYQQFGWNIYKKIGADIKIQSI